MGDSCGWLANKQEAYLLKMLQHANIIMHNINPCA